MSRGVDLDKKVVRSEFRRGNRISQDARGYHKVLRGVLNGLLDRIP